MFLSTAKTSFASRIFFCKTTLPPQNTSKLTKAKNRDAKKSTKRQNKTKNNYFTLPARKYFFFSTAGHFSI